MVSSGLSHKAAGRKNFFSRIMGTWRSSPTLLRFSTIFLLLTVLLLSVFPPSAFADCTKQHEHRDCTDRDRPVCDPGGRGHCVQCVNNGDCRGGQVCKSNRCKDPNTGGGGNPNPAPEEPEETCDGSISECQANCAGDPNCFTKAVTSETVDCEIDGDPNAGSKTELGICIPKNPAGFAQAYYKVGLSAIGGLALLFIIFGGYLMQTSEGQPERLNTGKKFIFYALFGLLLTIFGFVFIEVIAVDVLHIPGFSH